MDMNRPHDAANAASRRRLTDLLGRLREAEFVRPLEEGWTVGAVLAHVAFWDRAGRARWARYGQDGAVEEFPDTLIDIVNDACLEDWRALDPALLASRVLAAAEEIDALIAALPDAAVAHALATNRAFLVDRSGHRDEHIAAIASVLDTA
jgi:hypothetical protein